MPRISGISQGTGIQAVLLALRILEHMARSRGASGVTELAQAFETTKSRIYRHLQTLIEGGYVIRVEGSDRYRVSARLIEMGEAVSQNFEVAAAARPAMESLRADLGHSVAVSVPEADGIRIVAVVRGGSNAEIGVRPGSLLSLHASSQGKLALAFGDGGRLGELLKQPLESLTPETITDPDRLKQEINAVTERGWATSANQSLVGLNALAAPIFGAFGQYIGAIAIVDSVQFIGDTPTPEQITAVTAAAKRVSRGLGYREAS